MIYLVMIGIFLICFNLDLFGNERMVMKQFKGVYKFRNFIVSNNYFDIKYIDNLNLEGVDFINQSEKDIFDELSFLIGFKKILKIDL